MRKMKDSGIEWIGKIPEEWNIVRIKFTLEGHYAGAWGSNKEDNEANCICVRVADFDYPRLEVKFHDDMTIRSYTKKTIDKSSLKRGDILLEKSGGGEATPVGRSVIFDSDNTMMFANFIECLRPLETYDPHFLNYWLSSSYANGFSKRNIKQTTGIQNLDITAFLSEKIALPNKEKQSLIANYLDKKCTEIDALIEAKEKANALLKEQRQSIIYEAVTKGLNPDVPMKDSGIEWIGKIPKNWGISRFKNEFSLGKGLPITKAELTDNGIGVISYGQIHSKVNVGTTIKKEMVKYVDPKYIDSNISSMTYKGDIIFADTSEDLSGCGNCVYVDTDESVFAGYHTIIARPNKRNNSKYYAYLFMTDAWRSQIRAKVTGVKLFSITQTMLNDTLVILPTENDRDEILTYLDKKSTEIDRLIEANNTTAEKLKEYRKSIIFEAVTGKVEI